MEDGQFTKAIFNRQQKGRRNIGRPQLDGGIGTLFSYNYANATSRKAAVSIPDEFIGFLN
jgi:hypothetical protein